MDILTVVIWIVAIVGFLIPWLVGVGLLIIITLRFFGDKGP